MHQLLKIAGLLLWTLAIGSPAIAQGRLAPAITVNESVITRYELEQRRRLLELFRTPGDLNEVAREALIEDRLKQEAVRRAGLRLTDEALQQALEEFAGRANMNLRQFNAVLVQNNISPATLRDFVRVGVSWRDYIRSRYGNRVQVTERDINRALNQNQSGGSTIEILLSEIIIPAPPPEAERAQAVADQIARLRSTAAFEEQARRVSALPSRENGGRLDWLPITNYPPQLHGLLLDLSVGEVTAPINIPNGIALFQMRGVREVTRRAPAPASIDYAAYYIPGGRSEAGLRAAADLADTIDTCDDLYGIAKDQPTEVLDRENLPPRDIPKDIALEIARLDPGEVSYNLTRSDGETLVFLMLCERTAVGQGNVNRDGVRNQLRSQRLNDLATALVADLRASAIITYP